MANHDQPINGKRSTLTLLDTGNLVLIDAGQSNIWDTETSSISSLNLLLYNTENLILHDINDVVLWQSFDFPTNTLLPQQVFTRHINLVSSRGESNHSSGFYQLFFDNDNVLHLLYDGPDVSSVYWSDPWLLSWDAQITTYNSTRVAVLDALGQFNASNNFNFTTSDYGAKIQRRLTFNHNGNLRVYSWRNGGDKWYVLWQVKSRLCKIHGVCGANSLSTFNHISSGKWSCPPSYEMNLDGDWSYGYKPKFNFACQKTKSRFLRLSNVELYGYDYASYGNYTYKYCVSYFATDLYVRLPASSSFTYDESFKEYENLACPKNLGIVEIERAYEKDHESGQGRNLALTVKDSTFAEIFIFSGGSVLKLVLLLLPAAIARVRLWNPWKLDLATVFHVDSLAVLLPTLSGVGGIGWNNFAYVHHRALSLPTSSGFGIRKEKFLEVPQIVWGLNNQKIAFARACLTARMLNRTLLMPSLSASLFYKEVDLLQPISFDKVFQFEKFNTPCGGLGRDPFDQHEVIRIVGKNPFLWHDHWPVKDYAKIFECLILVDEFAKEADRVISKIRGVKREGTDKVESLENRISSGGSSNQPLPYVAVHMRIEIDWMIHCKKLEQRLNTTQICSSKKEIMERVGNIVGLKTPAVVYLAVADKLLNDSSILQGWNEGFLPFEKKKLGVDGIYSKYPYLIQSAIDCEVCLRADVFVGNSFSTFSSLIALERTEKMIRMGHNSMCGTNLRWPSYAYNIAGESNGPMKWATNMSDSSVKAVSYGGDHISCSQIDLTSEVIIQRLKL
ncbi:hypothetical protein L6164_036899 [Bauhinia variegata]|uniref:Uncharacterized protein n=1 Tax=Bauhinia variegata TaxID=167791 RepID=A0ACB9KIK2_BAUVA|nr:hypothetical protein L6164_036899 [Bauhinia variegata]